MFLGISQNSQENTCARVFFLIKLQPKGDSGTGVNFVKLLKTLFFIEQFWWLLLQCPFFHLILTDEVDVTGKLTYIKSSFQ